MSSKQRAAAPSEDTAPEALAPTPVVAPAPAPSWLKVAVGDEAQVRSPVHDMHVALKAELASEPAIKRWMVGPSILITLGVSVGLWWGLIRVGAAAIHQIVR